MDHDTQASDGRLDPKFQTDPLYEYAERQVELPKDQHDDSFLYTRMATLLDDITETGDVATANADFGIELDAKSEGMDDSSRPADLIDKTGNQPVSDSQFLSVDTSASTDVNGGPHVGHEPARDSSDEHLPDTHPPGLDEAIDSAAIRIRGRTDGVSIEIGDGDWHTLMMQLDARLEQAAGFFSGGQVALDVGGRTLLEAQLFQVRDVLIRYNLNPGMLRTTSSTTFEAALATGLAVTLEAEEGGERTVAQRAESSSARDAHYVYRGNLRSGQLLQRSESIMVVGDVNPGAQLVSDGDIFIWGRLRGIAHAGANGAEDSMIGALQFEPTQLRIGDLIAIPPKKESGSSGAFGRQQESSPARVAYVVDGQIVVTHWNEARRSGRSILRRQ